MSIEVLVLAERLRVEERLILDAFTSADCSARLVTPSEFLMLNSHPDCPSVINRLPATPESAALTRSAEEAGATVMNSSLLTGLLADRTRVLNRLRRAGVPMSPTMVAWEAASTLEMIETTGYPVSLAVLASSEPAVKITDRDAAEAIIEHRIVLGGDRLFIVQPAYPNRLRIRLHIVGDATFVEDGEPVDATAAERRIAAGLRAALGPGFYTAEVIIGDESLVAGVTSLGQFRAFHDAGFDLAGLIVQAALESWKERMPA